MQPESNKKQVVFKFSSLTQKYECDKAEEQKRLEDRLKHSPGILENTLNQLNTNRKLQPFNITMPFSKKLLFIMLAFSLKLLYIVIAFFFLQLALFNVILLGLLIMFFFKVNYYFDEFIIKKEFKYQNKEFDAFIAQQNELSDYKKACVNITGVEQGRYLEFHLPDDSEYQNNNSDGGDAFYTAPTGQYLPK